MTKECSRCQKIKPFSEFHKDKCAKNGIYSICKKCKNEQRKKYYHNNKEKVSAQYKRYRKKNKEKTNAREKRYREKNKERIKEYRKNNKEKIKKWYEENKEKIIAYQKKYRENNKEKATIYIKEYCRSERGKLSKTKSHAKRKSLLKDTTNDLTLEQWEQILEDQKNRCNGCNKKFTKKFVPQKDHIIPVSRGGGLTKDNVQALCRNCNSSKHNKTMEEWLAIKGKDNAKKSL